MRAPGNRGIQPGRNKFTSKLPYDTSLITGNDDEELVNSGNRESEDPLNRVMTPRRQDSEDATHLTALSESMPEEFEYHRGSDQLQSLKMKAVEGRFQNTPWMRQTHLKSSAWQTDFSTRIYMLAPWDCFEAVTPNGTNRTGTR